MVAQWQVSLQVESGVGPSGPASRSFTVQSKSASMAIEKAAQQARHLGLRILSIASCNPIHGTWIVGRR